MVDLSGNLSSLQIVTNIPINIIQGNYLSIKDAYHTRTNDQYSSGYQVYIRYLNVKFINLPSVPARSLTGLLQYKDNDF